MDNRKIEEAWNYHNSTKHPSMPPHYLDWDNQPIPFKIYTTLDPIKIPNDGLPTGTSALEAVSQSIVRGDAESIPDLRTLGGLLFFSAGITKKARYPGGELAFRAAACTGALYHIDLYLVTGDVDGLRAGVYHFGPHDFSLRRLRRGDFRGVLAEATGEEPSVSHAPVNIIFTSTFWRNSWKYQARAYRHTFWDSGTILANLLAVSSAHRIPASIVLGFDDSTVNRLLGLDTDREVAVTIVPIGSVKTPVQERTEEVTEIDYATMPLSRMEVDYPAIREIHLASSLSGEKEVREWRGELPNSGMIKPEGPVFPLEFADDKEANQVSDSVEKTILKRGSTRQFARVPITFLQLSNCLYRATRRIPVDYASTAESSLNDIYLIVNEVEGLPKGAYVYHRNINVIELLKEGDFRNEAGHLGLGQRIPADASADIFFLTDLSKVLEVFGNRGYGAAQLEAGIMGGKLYLGAYSQGLGASGLTFYDDTVTEFFSPHSAGKSCMFLVAIGKSVTRK